MFDKTFRKFHQPVTAKSQTRKPTSISHAKAKMEESKYKGLETKILILMFSGIEGMVGSAENVAAVALDGTLGELNATLLA